MPATIFATSSGDTCGRGGGGGERAQGTLRSGLIRQKRGVMSGDQKRSTRLPKPLARYALVIARVVGARTRTPKEEVIEGEYGEEGGREGGREEGREGGGQRARKIGGARGREGNEQNKSVQADAPGRQGWARTSKPAEEAHSAPSTPQMAALVTCPVPIRWSST